MYQSNSNAYVAYKVQSALGTAASGAAASVFRISGGNGIKASKAAVESNEIRRDGMRQRGRHGTQKLTADYDAELSLGSHDAFVEAIARDTWSAADLTKTQADFTSLTTGANSIILAAGDPRTWFGIGDVIELLNYSGGNNLQNIRVTGLSSTTITSAETLVVNASADTACSIVRRGKKLVPYAGGSLIKRYFTMEEYEIDIDQSKVAQDFVAGQLKLSMKPDGIIMAGLSGVGTGRVLGNTTGTSPYFTSPVLGSNAPFSVVDATIRLGSQDLVSLTNFDLTADITPNAPSVFGSGGIKYSPDVFTGQMGISLNLGMLYQDLTIFQDFLAETTYTLHVLAVDNEAEPKDFFSIYMGNFTLGGADPSAFSNQGGGRTQTVQVPIALAGIDGAGAGHDAAIVKFQTSAP
jgi:hypothetical protein